MVNLFGDWFNDFVVIAFIFIVYIIYRIWLNKDKLHNEWALVTCAALIFVVSIYPFFSNIFWYDNSSLSVGGGYLSFIIGAVSLITLIFGLKRIYKK